MEELTRSRSLTELEKTTEHRVAESAKSTAKHMQKQAAISAEKASKNKGSECGDSFFSLWFVFRHSYLPHKMFSEGRCLYSATPIREVSRRDWVSLAFKSLSNFGLKK